MANNNPNPNKFKVSPWLVYTGILLIFLFISFATGGSNFEEPAQLTSSKFNNFLEKGQIEKVIVYHYVENKPFQPNKEETATPAKIPQDEIAPLNDQSLGKLPTNF